MTGTRTLNSPRIRQSAIIHRRGLLPSRIVLTRSNHYHGRYACYFETFVNGVNTGPVEIMDNLSLEQAENAYAERLWALTI